MQQDKLVKIMERLAVDAIIVSNGYNMRYISGFEGATGYLFITRKKELLLTDSRYTTQALEESPDFRVIEIDNTKGYTASLLNLVHQEKVKKVGFEDTDLIYSDYLELKDRCGIEEWIPLGQALNELRMIKTEEEIERHRRAEAIGDMAFDHILGYIRPGMTEIDIAVELESFMRRNGADGLAFGSIVASGVRSALPHAVPTEKKVEESDFITMDYGCTYQGYCADMTRTVVLGKAGDRQKEIYQIVLDAQLTSLEAIHEGMRGCDVDAVARDLIKDKGYGDYFGHGLGHSVGLEVHENPRFSPSCEMTIKENMLMTVEPGIYIPGFGGVRIEDMVVVKKDGYENLAHSSKQLIEL